MICLCTVISDYFVLQSLYPVLNSKRVYFSQEDQVKLYHRVLFIMKPYASSDVVQEVGKT